MRDIKFKIYLAVFISIYSLLGCEGDLLFRTAPCSDGQVRKGDVCVSENAKGSVECKNPDLNKLQKGESVTMCDGSLGEGKLVLSEVPLCSKDGEQKCIADGVFKVADTSKLSASKIGLGTTIAGVTGTKRDIKQCRNAANLTYFDFTPVDDTKKIPNRINSFPGGNAVQLGWNHGLATNDPIQIYCTGGTGTSLNSGGIVNTNSVYYALVVSANQIRFQATPSGGALSVTGIGGCTGTWVVSSSADGVAQDTDTIGEDNSLTSSYISPWSSDYLCNESNFTNVSGSAPLAPSNTVATNASQSWTQIWRDELTGLLMTNILYEGTPNNRDWFQLNAMCKSLDGLNGGSGGTGWRLPTFKELLQLHIDGISKLVLAGGSVNNYFWSSTGDSVDADYAWRFYLGYGTTQTFNRNSTNASALCVR